MKEFARAHRRSLIVVLSFLILLTIINITLGSIWASFMLGVGTLLIYVYLFIKYGEEALRPFDGLTGLRYIVFYTVILGGVLTVPGIVYNALQLLTVPVEMLQPIIRITNGLSRIVVPVLLVLVAEYKNEDAK